MACATCGRAHVPERCKDGQIEYLAGLFPCPLKAAPVAPPPEDDDPWTIKPEDDL